MSNSPQSSMTELFKGGNYAGVALKGDREDWQTYAALGLIGKTQEAIEGLSRFDNEQAYFYCAVAHWIGDNEEKAAHILETIPTAHAQNLLSLITKPKIQILSQLPWHRNSVWDLLTAAAADSKFQVKNIGFHPEDLPNQPYADIHQFYEPHQPPDFYICQMVEWHLIPPNLQQLPCPILGQTADYDLHIQAVYPWLQLFDEIIVTDQSEWQDVRQLVKVPVSTFPKSFGLPDSLPPIPMGTREFDLFVSGTVTHPYHPDKAQLLHQILRLPQIKLKIINGFEGSNEYYNNLSNAKVCYTYIRHAQALPTRGLEALSMGCGLVVQKDSVLTLFAGEQQAVLTYELEENNLECAIRRIVDQWPEFEQRAKQGAEIIRQEFTLSRVASQYLRFLTFLAAKPRGQRQMQPVDKLYQKRAILEKGWLPSYDFCDSPILKRLGIANNSRLQALINAEPFSSQLYIDQARESVLYNYHQALHRLIPVQEWLSALIRIYKTGLSRFPQSLVLRFNFIRSVLHFGQPQAVLDALNLLEETLSLPVSHWQIDVMEDVFPWDFCPKLFNYRQYFDLVTEHFRQGAPVETALCKLILASLHYYKGFYSSYQGYYSQSLDDFKQATHLDPEFPFYKFHYAKQLLERGLPEDYAEAGALLTQLTEQSILFWEALELLVQFKAKLSFTRSQLEKLAATLEQAKLQIRFVENFLEALLQPAVKPTQAKVEPKPSLSQPQPTQAVAQPLFRYPNPQLVETFGPYNIVAWKDNYYGLLNELGHVDISVDDLSQFKTVLSEKSLDELKKRIFNQSQFQLQQTQAELERLHNEIQAMESSKFWKLRKAWFRVKQSIRLTQELKK